MSMFPVPSPTQSNWISVWRSVSCSICSVSHWIFSPERLCSFGRILTKHLCWAFWLNIFEVCFLVLVQEQDKAAANLWEYFLCRCRLCYTPCTGGVSFIFSLAVHFSRMEPHFHCLKLNELLFTDNSLCAFEFFFKNDKKTPQKTRRKSSLTDKPVWKTFPLIWTPNRV